MGHRKRKIVVHLQGHRHVRNLRHGPTGFLLLVCCLLLLASPPRHVLAQEGFSGLEGRWHLLCATDESGILAGTLTLDASGILVGGEVEDSLDFSSGSWGERPLAAGTHLFLSSTGEITGNFVFADGERLIVDGGQLSPDRALAVLRTEAEDGTGDGLVALLRFGGTVFSGADLAGRWRTHFVSFDADGGAFGRELYFGDLVSDADGNLSAFSGLLPLIEPVAGDPLVIDTGSLAIDPLGRITGTAEAVRGPLIFRDGKLDAFGRVMTLAVEGFPDQGQGGDAGMMICVRASTAAEDRSADGAWGLGLLTLPATGPRPDFESPFFPSFLSVGDAGELTGTAPDGRRLLHGTLTSDGNAFAASAQAGETIQLWIGLRRYSEAGGDSSGGGCVLSGGGDELFALTVAIGLVLGWYGRVRRRSRRRRESG